MAKLNVMNSQIGRSPLKAAPTAMPRGEKKRDTVLLRKEDLLEKLNRQASITQKYESLQGI